MRILIVTHHFWPENFRINEISSFLANQNIEIDVYTSYPDYPNKKIYSKFKYDGKKFNKKINIIRIPSFSRREGSRFRLFLNYFSFVLFGILFSHLKLFGKKYDFIFTFGTSPVTVAILSIYINFFKRSKLILWLLDYWPDIIFELGYVKNKLYKHLIVKTVKYIYNKHDCILAQSNSYLEKIKKSTNPNLNQTFLYFPSWPEKISIDIDKNVNNLFNQYKDFKKIVFTGNIGEAQGFENIIEFCENFSHLKFKIFVVGTGRWINKIKTILAEKKIDQIIFCGHRPVNKIYSYLNNADILLISLKKGKVFDATVPGKFSTYVQFNKPILGFIGGETKDLINNNFLGLALEEHELKNNKSKISEFVNNNYLNQLNNDLFIEKNLAKEKILYNLKNYIHNSYEFIKIIKQAKQINFDKNFVLSAFNLAFIGSWISKEIKIYKELICWPDGLFKNILDMKIDKLPGRELIQNLKITPNIKKIRIVGNSSVESENFLKKIFKINNIINNEISYGNIDIIKKELNFKIEPDELTLITLPTPKQEMIAEYLKDNNKTYRIICIGGGLKMASGEELPPPKILENYGLETLWRLRHETIRRFKRLVKSFFYFLKGYYQNQYKYLKIKNVKNI